LVKIARRDMKIEGWGWRAAWTLGCCALALGAPLACDAPRPTSSPQADARDPSPPSAPQALPTPRDEPAAKVGAVFITQAQVEREFSRVLALREQLGPSPDAAWRAHKRRAILQDLIERALLEQAAQDRGLQVTPAQVDQEQRRRIETTFLTRAAFDNHLQKAHRTEDEYRDELKKDLLLARLIGAKDAIFIPREQLEALYQDRKPDLQARERVKLSALVLKVPPRADPAQRKELELRAKSLCLQARARGTDFAALARQYSEAPTAAQGGLLGWVYPSQLEEHMAAQVFKLPVGAVSDPIQTRLGFQVVKVWDHRPAGTRELDEVEDTLRDQLRTKRWRALRDGLLQELKKTYPVTELPSPPTP
jgi:parvulin-like peptidyl-prolyl isomerase